MGTYRYKARDKFGKLISGVVEAASENALVMQLEQKHCVTLQIVPIKKKEKTGHFLDRLKFGRVRFSDLNTFTRLLFTLQNAGLPILTSLHAIREQTLNPSFKGVIGEVAKDVEEGGKLSSALEKHPRVFNDLYVNMIHSGEISGRLPEVLERLAVLGEHDEAIRLRVKSALRYPAIVVAAIIIAFLILITYVVPRYESLFSKYDTKLPLPTLILLGLNYAITKYWWMSLLVIGALVFLIRYIIRTPKGSLLWNTLQLKIPVFGPLRLKLYMSRFSRITGTLLSSGVPILQILDLVSQSINNIIVSEAIKGIRESVNTGKGMLEPMKASGLFPPIVSQMVSAGEETGKLDTLLIHISEYYDAQIDYTINNMVALIEPLLILVMGSAVLGMALGIFMPMWNLMRLFKG
jgi:type II secretory pathway component PulF